MTKIKMLLQFYRGERRIRVKLDKHPQSLIVTELSTEIDGHREGFQIENKKGFDVEISEDPKHPGGFKLSVD